LRSLELHANEVFDIYRELYYGKSTSVSSVYLWDKEEQGRGAKGKPAGFAGCFLIQNRVNDANYWNSIHVVDAGTVQNGNCTYKLTTTILLSVTPTEQQLQSTTISGSLTRHNTRENKVEEGVTSNSSSSSSHIINIGKFIEDVESEMRSEMDSLYIQKTRTVVESIRKECPRGKTEGEEHTKVLNDAVLAMAMSRKAKIV